MLSKSEVETQLRHIWQNFAVAGITDPLTIIENLAHFFLREHFKLGERFQPGSFHRQQIESLDYTQKKFEPLDLGSELQQRIPEIDLLHDFKQLIPQMSSSLKPQRYLEIRDEICELLAKGPPAGEIFNEIIPEFLVKMEPGGRYFTPRHLTRWSALLLEIRQGYTLADLACGSGGFLVAATEKEPRVIGVEISPNWARLAFTNCLLHGIENPDIRIGNSLAVFGKKGKSENFDAVLMNPPFGATVDESLVDFAFDSKLSGRSETVLTSLALNHLAENGQMVVFLPSGSLFANSGGEQTLREDLINQGWLSAVVSFPKDAFQPYSQVATHALFIEKKQQLSRINWFFRPRFDGFTSGRNRQPDPDHNDLPLITAGIRSRKDPNPVVPLQVDQKGLAGYRVLLPDVSSHLRVDRLTRLNTSEACFLVGFGADLKRGYFWINQTDIQNIDDQKHSIALSWPDTFEHEVNETILQGAYSIKLSTQGGEIRNDRKSTYSIQLQAQWDEDAWMGLIINIDGRPVGPAFTLREVPNRIKDADETVFTWDYKIAFETVLNGTTDIGENHGTLVLFPPGRLEGMRFSEHEYFLKSGKHHWLRVHLDQNNYSKIEIFLQDENEPIFETDGRQSGVVFTRDGEVIGVAVPSTIIHKTDNLDLQPSSYFPRKRETSEAGRDSPAQILADIQNSQTALARQVGKLLTLSELKPTASEQIPPRVVITNPMGRMQGIQKAVWDALQTMVEKHGDEFVPKPFRIGDIESAIEKNLEEVSLNQPDTEVDSELGLNPDTEQDLQMYKAERSFTEELVRALDLFERMGVVVRVSINGAEYYRLISGRELVQGNPL